MNSDDDDAPRPYTTEEANLRWGMRVEDLGLSLRVIFSLRKVRILTVSCLIKKTEQELVSLTGFRPIFVKEVKDALMRYSLVLTREEKSL